MSKSDADDMTPGMTAFFVAFMGGLVVTVGLVVSIFFWPVGILLFAVGALCIVLSPAVWFVARQGDAEPTDAEAA